MPQKEDISQPKIPLHSSLLVRDAHEEDLNVIQQIYAHYVLNGFATFEEIPPTREDLYIRHEAIFKAGLPYLVAETNHCVLGYTYATTYRPRSAYRHTIENSVYVAEDCHGKGVGRALLSALIERCEAGSWRQMIAVICDSGNLAAQPFRISTCRNFESSRFQTRSLG